MISPEDPSEVGHIPWPEAFAAAAQDGLVRVPVKGHSMLPALAPGDVALVAPGAPATPGQVVVYQSGSTLILHRFLTLRPRGKALVKGDNAPVWELVPLRDILGPVVARERHGRRVTLRLGPQRFLAACGLVEVLVRWAVRRTRTQPPDRPSPLVQAAEAPWRLVQRLLSALACR